MVLQDDCNAGCKTSMTRRKTTATRTLSIRVPETLAAKLDAVADRHDVTRTAVLCSILEGAIDDWQPATPDATQTATQQQDDTLPGAIEALRLELDETIERVARLERARQNARLLQDSARRIATQAQDETDTKAAVTIAELRARFGWKKANAARTAAANGWVKIGKRGQQTLWEQACSTEG